MKQIIAILLVFLNQFGNTQSVALDFSFNTSGTAVTSIGTGEDKANSVAVQTDGKIVVAGNSTNGTDVDFAVVRYTIDGSLDTSFDADGKMTIHFTGAYNNCQKVVIQPDGKIIIAGRAYNGADYDFTMIRLLANGSLDPTFGIAGIVVKNFHEWDAIYDLALQPDGKIVAVGSTGFMGFLGSISGDNVATMRFNSDGTLDSGFDDDPLPFIYDGGNASSVIIQPDGKIVIGASMSSSFGGYYGTNYVLARYNSHGSFDTTFNSTGYLSLNFSGQISLQPDGKFIVTGCHAMSSWSGYFCGTTRINSNGTIDSSFLDPGTSGNIGLQSDGKIILANSLHNNFTIQRYNTDGTFDNTFGPTGDTVETDFGINDYVTSTALMTDGRIVVAGYTDSYGTNDFAVARYNINAVGIDENKFENNFNLYPNPVNELLNISSNTSFKNASLKIINMSGQVIFTQHNINGNKLTVDMSDQTRGVYIVEMSENGSVSRTKLIRN